MATASKSCGVCELRHITKLSIIWCTECDEELCTDCQEHHSLSKPSRRHNVIPINEYQKLLADVLEITQYCTAHDKKYQMYCQKHECPCCSKCIVESHKECGDFVDLVDVIHNVKTSNAMCETEETLVEVAENLQKIRQHQQNNVKTFQENNRLIYSGYDRGIRMINLYDESISDITRDKMPCECNIATFRDNIYHTNYETDYVTCYNLQGEIQWTIKNERVLSYPRDIDVDHDGNVYVVGFTTNNVVVISPDGQRHRKVLTASAGLYHPTSLHYSGQNNQLLIANCNTQALLFNVI
ncbi:unnamed protein product [Mytilus coruscus]|uniref:B box-type domain-containing protein n=1 Tax=Mytilus coruscus TaxID=42192 RepID=A0A6J8EB57_MYTCO|nr:unnamed protein product [Mytilus coruscus]